MFSRPRQGWSWCLVTLVALVCLVALASGCGARRLPKTTSTPLPPPDDRPPDLAIAATVFSPRVPLPIAELPRSLQPARYIIEADGVLRAARGQVRDEFPSRARQLSPREVDQLWRLLRESDLLSDGNPARIDAPEGVVRSGDRTTAMIYVSYAGRRTTLRVLLDRSSPDAIEAEKFIDRLAELSWAR